MAQLTPPWQPLKGLKVLDFSLLLPGPFATAVLGDLGAEIIKVEPLSGDPLRSMMRSPTIFRNANRNKRSLAIDLKKSESAEIIGRLAKACDIAVEGFRPGVAARLGIDHLRLKSANPAIIYCSLSGYGQDGPWRDMPGHDGNYLAASGALSFSGHWLEAPRRSGLPVADFATGSLAAVAILSALRQRDATGEGAYLDMSLFESALYYTSIRHGMGTEQTNRDHLTPGNDIFETSDGRRFAFAPVEEHFWKRFQQAVASMLPDILDEKFISSQSRRTHGDELAELLRTLFLSRPAQYWMDFLNQFDLPAQLCLSPAEARESAQVSARGMITWIDDEALVAFPVHVDGKRGAHVGRAAPELGQDSMSILGDLGFNESEQAQLLLNSIVATHAGSGRNVSHA